MTCYDIKSINVIHVNYYNLMSYKDNDIKGEICLIKYSLFPVICDP